MPGYIVTLKKSCTDEQVKEAKQHVVDQGGKIGHEYTLIKGFAVTFPEDKMSALESSPHVEAVEADGEVKTQ